MDNSFRRLNPGLHAASRRPNDLVIPASTSAADFNTAWGVTMPAALDTLPEPVPFQETLPGVAMREVNEPDLFKHFFG
jgi:hypothetical protein